MPHWQPFKTGDHVRLRNGGTMMTVIYTRGSTVFACYTHKSNKDDPGRCDKRGGHDCFVLWDFNDPKSVHYPPEYKLVDIPLSLINPSDLEGSPIMATPTPTLYQTKENKPRYGTFLVKNGTGQYVLEMKGEGGKVEAFDESALDKVIPYTFKAKARIRSEYVDYHFICAKDAVAVDDVLVSRSGNIYIVTAINTGCETPHKTFKGSKLTSSPFGD